MSPNVLSARPEAALLETSDQFFAKVKTLTAMIYGPVRAPRKHILALLIEVASMYGYMAGTYASIKPQLSASDVSDLKREMAAALDEMAAVSELAQKALDV